MIPVVMIHWGKPAYLQYSIKQALKKNKVILLSDVNEPHVEHENYTHENMYSFMDKSYADFTKNYVHMSTNPYNFELVCFLRWFLLRKYMSDKKIDVVFYIDSDVLLYVDVNDEYKKYEQYDMTVLHRTAHISSFITKVGMNNFCNFISETYREKNSYEFEKIKSHYDVRQKFNLPGGVCDMTLTDYFHYHGDVGGGPDKVGEMMSILDNSTYDQNINCGANYFNHDGSKKIVEFIDDIPYVYNKKLNKLIKFNCLHFQGSAKSLIKEYYEKTNKGEMK